MAAYLVCCRDPFDMREGCEVQVRVAVRESSWTKQGTQGESRVEQGLRQLSILLECERVVQTAHLTMGM